MTQEQQIKYMRIAASLCHLHFTEEQIDLLVNIYEGVMVKEGEFSLRDAYKIVADCEGRTRTRNLSKMLDKISEKKSSTEPQKVSKRKNKTPHE